MQFSTRATLTLESLVKQLESFGPSAAKDLCGFLKISQASFSRLIKAAERPLLRIGRGPQTRYAHPRLGPWGKWELPLAHIDDKGTLSIAATLHPISPRGFYLESRSDLFSSRLYEGLPYFLEDLRPAGFLGRLVPRLHSDLGLPEDITRWTDDHCLYYLSREGWDLIGNLMVGEGAQEAYISHRLSGTDIADESLRETQYPKLANLVLSHGIPGSSAGGEQPKFLSIRKTKTKLLPVLVKFSPPVVDAISQRVADLLVCEHIAHDVLKQHGQTSLQSCLIQAEDRLFLEMERFDRIGQSGRRGIISLRALDLEFVGQLRSWAETAEALFKQKKIDHATYQTIIWLEVFGKLIGNSDRHHGNISFFCGGENLLGLAPVYDMLPMMYAPQQNQLIERSFEPAPPKFSEIPIWNSALEAARDFWTQVQRHAQISEAFKILTAKHNTKLSSYVLKVEP